MSERDDLERMTDRVQGLLRDVAVMRESLDQAASDRDATASALVRALRERDALRAAAREYFRTHDAHWNYEGGDDATEDNLYEAEEAAMSALRAASSTEERK